MKEDRRDMTSPGRSYTSGISDQPLLGITIGDMFDRIVDRQPDREALVSRHQGIRYTYRELREESGLGPSEVSILGATADWLRYRLPEQYVRRSSGLVADTFGIAQKDVFFEPSGKVDRLKAEKVELFYGDSDGDIEDAKAAGIPGVRFLRSPHSSHRGDYNVGKFGEEILVGSYDEL